MRLAKFLYFYVKSRYTKGFLYVSLLGYLFVFLSTLERGYIVVRPYVNEVVIGDC